MAKLSIAQIKQALPDIPVMHGGKRKIGRVVGRELKFPTVFLTDSPSVHAEVSWQVVQRANNEGIAISLD